MKKTYNINIAGRVFTIDEDAYTLLNDYLDTLGNAFSRMPESSDIIQDIEDRIAELFGIILEENRCEVINIVATKAVIERIGSAQDMLASLDEDVELTGAETFRPNAGMDRTGNVPPPYQPHIRKRLFRNPKDKELGGVCSGLAAYADIDPTWIRLILVALCFCSFATVSVIYIILWIVLPEANTPLEQMQMTGKQPTIDNIGRTVTEGFERENPSAGAYERENRSGVQKFADSLANIFGVIAKIFIIGLTIIAIPVVFALAMVLVACLIAAVSLAFGLTMPSWFVEITPEMNYVKSIACAVSTIIVIGLPLVMLIWSFIRKSANKSTNLSSGWKISLVSLWVVALLVGGFTFFRVTKDIQNTKGFDIELLEKIDRHTEQIDQLTDSLDQALDSIDE